MKRNGKNKMASERVASAHQDRLTRAERIRAPKFVTARQLLRKPAPIKWVIRGILPADAIIGFVGAVESLKSAIVCDVSVSVATGTDWHGQKVTAGPVFIIAGEGHAGFSRRLKAIEIDRGLHLANFPLRISRSACGLGDRRRMKALAQRLDRICAKIGEPPALIVVDTLARNFGLGDENSAADMGTFIDNVDYLRMRYHCALIVVHHSGHSDKGRARGSSAFKAALDWEIVFDRRGDQVTLRCTKSKDAPRFKDQSFDMEEVTLPWTDEEGQPETSIVLKSADIVATSGAAPKKQIAAFKLLKKLISEATDGGASGDEHPGVLRKVWQRKSIAQKIVRTDQAFEKLVAKIKTRGKISINRKGLVTLI